MPIQRRASTTERRSSGPAAALAGERHVREQVEAAVDAPVAHAGGAAVADLDEPGLLQALERLADGVPVDGERLGEQALGGQRRRPGA